VATSLAGSPRERRSQCPKQHLVPAVGIPCGRREREADVGNQDAQASLLPAVATVEGTPIHGMPVAFAGCRRNVGLGRSVMSAVGLVSCSARTDDSGCPLEQRGGERRQRAPSARTLRVRTLKRRSPRRRTRPSLSPETRARQSALNSCGASRKGCRGRFGIAVGQTCASRRNRHRGLVERTKRGSPRITAAHVKLGRSCVMRPEKEGGHGHRPCEETGARVWLPVRRKCSCRSRQAASWPRISSHAALQKEWR
jgi:hypothetical protein